jgi:hypothetical protein
MRAWAIVWVFLFGCGLAQAGEGQIEIGPTTSFPIIINQPGSYLLTADLTVPASANGIEIQADNVTLDLGGHSITGPGAIYGVFASQVSGIAVRNGVVSHFQAGLYLAKTGGAAFQVEGIRAASCGIGIYALDAVITNCTANNNTGTGVQLSRGTISSTQASFNGVAGFYLLGSTCDLCTALVNDQYGFDISSGHNLLTSCNAVQNLLGNLNGTCTSGSNACFNSNLP